MKKPKVLLEGVLFSGEMICFISVGIFLARMKVLLAISFLAMATFLAIITGKVIIENHEARKK
jgi:hypothetical protein